MNVYEAASEGSHLELLVAMRNRIAEAVADPECPPRDLAALTKRLSDIAKEIETLSAVEEQEAVESEVPGDEAFDPASI